MTLEDIANLDDDEEFIYYMADNILLAQHLMHYIRHV